MMKISLLHHWLVSMRGGEKVLEQFCKLMPEAEIHTLVYNRDEKAISDEIRKHEIYTTWIDSLPNSDQYYQKMLPLFPHAIGNHSLDADFVLSSDAGMVKGMKIPENIPHVCYCHSPPRYLWDMQEEYLNNMGKVSRALFKKVTPRLRKFDLQSSRRVTHFIANSLFVKERISRIYGRDADVIYPPVNLKSFKPSPEYKDYYLVVSALVPYKRVDVAIEAFNKLGKNLIVIGEGAEKDRLMKLANENISFKGGVSEEELRQYYAECKAFIFPGVEDFGITPLEAQASGRPVIAFGRGGALETVLDQKTGLFFHEQTAESLTETVQNFEQMIDRFKWEECRKNAERFSEERFREELIEYLKANFPSHF